MSYELDDDESAVEVVDEGIGFDPGMWSAAPAESDEGGLGISIIRAIIDELDIKSRARGPGSRLRFTKYL